jgi:hypothetical protein
MKPTKAQLLAHSTCLEVMQKMQVPINEQLAKDIALRCRGKGIRSALSLIEKGLKPYIEKCQTAPEERSRIVLLNEPPAQRDTKLVVVH